MTMTELTVVRSPAGFHRSDLVRAFLQLRKAVFIDDLEWPLYQYDEIEFEQSNTHCFGRDAKQTRQRLVEAHTIESVSSCNLDREFKRAGRQTL